MLLCPRSGSQGEGSGWGHLVGREWQMYEPGKPGLLNVKGKHSEITFILIQRQKNKFFKVLSKRIFFKKIKLWKSIVQKNVKHFISWNLQLKFPLNSMTQILCCWCYSYFIPWCNTMVINTNMIEKVIKLLTYSTTYFGTYLRTTATKNWNFFISVCILMRQVWDFLKWNFYLRCFCRPFVSHEKMQQEGTHKDKSTYRAKNGMKLRVSQKVRKKPPGQNSSFQWKRFCFLPQLL